MAFTVVTFKDYPSADEQFAVYHSTTGTMFSETFAPEEELDAYIFAAWYANHRAIPQVFTEKAQREVSRGINAWLNEVAPHPVSKLTATRAGVTRVVRETEILSERNLPEAWMQALNPDEDVDVCIAGNPARRGVCGDPKCVCVGTVTEPRYTLDQLLEDFRNGESKVEFIVDEFSTWWKAHQPAAKV